MITEQKAKGAFPNKHQQIEAKG